MKKVGIMSMQRIANYGSFLQAYGLKSLIEELGCAVEFVDYHVGSPLIDSDVKNQNPFTRKIGKGLETFKYKAPLKHKFEFIKYKQQYAKKYMPLLGISENMNYNPKLDCLVIGSDEVFNCIQKNTNVGYSLELFGKDNKANTLISYAASFGNTTVQKIEKYHKTEELGNLLNQFDAISVRDNNSGSIVSTISSKTPVYHLDPVLTYDYMHKCKDIPEMDIKEKYLILYAYSGRITEQEADWIQAYAKKKKLKVYAIGGIQKCADRFIDCSPFEVLAYFKNAQEIITDTFHGSIFSIINHKPFTTIIRKSVGDSYGNEEKLSDLLKRLNLADRMTTDIETVQTINSKMPDYSNTDSIIASYRKQAKEYLTTNIVGDVNE
ncbi:polysaccharide pyruvyl transferase family protein [uncultured Holdemanella sp.]|mgnify:FL=1|uniref:polysaccharide pyruvyl transferase family protein n=1 Tax=uncultured Holdemanella sp. TaxID=1763549 RepID=UPI0025D28EA7|nr:polysaccharide pyruvyl transferase family protein [uncultured Holdemanella sp.]